MEPLPGEWEDGGGDQPDSLQEPRGGLCEGCLPLLPAAAEPEGRLAGPASLTPRVGRCDPPGWGGGSFRSLERGSPENVEVQLGGCFLGGRRGEDWVGEAGGESRAKRQPAPRRCPPQAEPVALCAPPPPKTSRQVFRERPVFICLSAFLLLAALCPMDTCMLFFFFFFT